MKDKNSNIFDNPDSNHSRLRKPFYQHEIYPIRRRAGNKVVMWRTADPHTGVQIPPRPRTSNCSVTHKHRDRKVTLLVIIGCFILVTSLGSIGETKELTYIVINEVLYNPETNDNYNEWIELYNPTNNTINVSGWSITDNSAADFLEGDTDHGNGTTMIPPYGYAILADHGTTAYENFSITNETIKLYVDDKSIGNGLGNNEDKLILKNNTGRIIDAIEWGDDYPEVPGFPAEIVNEGHSLARHPYRDTNDSSTDFYEGVTPTPGRKNTVVAAANLDVALYPLYLPKIQNNSEYGLPFAIKPTMNNFTSYQSYQIKAYVIGNSSSRYPATQIWNGTSWTWSYYYVNNITTDEQGNWSDWLYLRFRKDYQEYQRNIENNSIAYLSIKIKNDNATYECSKTVYLLDLDESTSNGTPGGYVVGIAEKNTTYFQNKTVIIENSSGVVTGIYQTEDNNIEDNFITTPGYHKIASPAGSGYTLRFLDNNGSLLYMITNITIEQGDYGVRIGSPEPYYLVRRHETLAISLSVNNSGDFNDTISIGIDYISDRWQATLAHEQIVLRPGEQNNTTIHITPCQRESCRNGIITIVATSMKDLGQTDTMTIHIELLGPDLTITNITCYDEHKQKNTTFGEGEIIRIKAFVKNIGNENATHVNVTYYYDHKDKDHCIGTKYYDSIGKYQKYPSVEWDTKDVAIGKHTLFVVVDEKNHIEEIAEGNNERVFQIKLQKTYRNNSRHLVITEVYYHPHPRVNNEFIAIHNPTPKNLDISGWYITDQPHKKKDEQTKIIFPSNTTIMAKTCLVVTKNVSGFYRETGKQPDFEYAAEANDQIPQMETQKTLRLSNTGDAVALKDGYNHTIDMVVYGETDDNFSAWKGAPIPRSGMGVILKRNFNDDTPVDTNTSNDWKHPRRYGVGQSDFPRVALSCTGEITTFVSPDCSFKAITDELRKATQSIYFNIYEFTNPFLCDELIAALRRNVSVTIFAEGSPVGGIDERETFILNRIKNHGGKIRFIVNDRGNDVYARYTFDHGKYLVIDNTTVIVESCNWAKTGIPIDPTFGNREWGIMVRNSTVAHYFLKVFFDDFNPERCDSYAFEDMGFSISPDFYPDETVLTGSYEPQVEATTFCGNFTTTPVFSPDTSERTICNLIESANESIYIEQLYIYKDWEEKINPFVERLVNKSLQDVDVKIILNYNPAYEETNEKCNETKHYLEEHEIMVKFVYTNWSIFTNIHNKGMIVDNKSVLIASINWNENSVTRNREAGIIIENQDVAEYYTEIFFYDWELEPSQHMQHTAQRLSLLDSLENYFAKPEHKNTIYIGIIFTMTFAVIARDWRKRPWT